MGNIRKVYLMNKLSVRLAAGLLASTALLLSACSSTGEGQSSEPDAAGLSMDELYSAAQEVGTVTVYGAFQSTYEPIYAEFEKAYPGLEVVTVDIYGPQLAAALEGEIESSSVTADILATGPVDVTAFDANGWIAPYKAQNATHLDDVYRGQGNSYVAPLGINAIFAYNTDLAVESDLPKSWTDFGLLPKGSLILPDPGIPGLASQVLATGLEHGVFDTDFLRDLKNETSLQDNPAQTIQALATGQASIAMLVPFDLIRNAKSEGAPVDYFLLEEDNAFIPTAFAVVKDAPNASGAQLLQEWLLTDDGQRAIAQRALQGTSDPELAPSGGMLALASHSVMIADLDASQLAEHTAVLSEIFN